MNNKDFEAEYGNVPDYSGYCPDCPQCGATMGYSYVKSEFKCPDCDYVMDEDDWERDDTDEDGVPWGCKQCGGPYPNCTSACFDD